MPARWRVTDNQPGEDLQPSGRFESVRRLTFEVIDNGTTGHVSVPVRNLTAEYVAATIQPLADAILATSNLTSEG
jgi:hypothetical protein